MADISYYLINTQSPNLVRTNIYDISDRSGRLVAYGITNTDVVRIEVFSGDAASGSWGPLYRRGSQVVLVQTNNQLLESFVGKYRAIYEGVNTNIKVWFDSNDLDIDRTVNYIFPENTASGNGFALTAQNSLSIALTYTGDNNAGTLQADAILSAVNPNSLSVAADGLLVPPPITYYPQGISTSVDVNYTKSSIYFCLGSSTLTTSWNLPDVSTVPDGTQIIVKNVAGDVNDQSVTPFGADNIEGTNVGYSVTPGKSVVLSSVAAGTLKGWWIVGGVF
jgi:hypothetical protein